VVFDFDTRSYADELQILVQHTREPYELCI